MMSRSARDWICLAADVIGKERFDLTIDPPPDLAIEIDIHPPDVARQPIYAALGVPEVWRFDGRELVCLQRRVTGTYVACERSLAFPDLEMKMIHELLIVGLKLGQSKAVAELKARLTKC
jgi:Uma2 family endonuclease